MIDAGILDGDTIIIRRGDTAGNGSIVVALVDENEVTLKGACAGAATRSRSKPPIRATRPASSGPDRGAKVQGRLLGSARRY